MSTRQLDNSLSQRLPPLRTTAKKYGRWAPREHTDVVINTSAIGRAFPNFSQGGSSDDSMSLEVGRVPQSRLNPTRSVQLQQQQSEDLESSKIGAVGNIKVLGTPKSSSNNLARRDTGSHKENIPPPDTQESSKRSPYTSHASRASSGERHTLAELHAKVADDTDGSIILEERPIAITSRSKNSRFTIASSTTTTRNNISHINPSPVANVSSKRLEVEDDLAEKLRTASGTPSKSQIKAQPNHTTNSNTINPTQQSFLLPTMHETSGLIPTSFNRGTRVPLPHEEQDIYVNIDLLRDRVADLESQLSQALKRNEQQEDERRQMKRQALTQNDQFKVHMERDQAIAQLSKALHDIEHMEKENTLLKLQEAHLAKSLCKNEELEKENARLHRQVTNYSQLVNQKEQLEKQNEEFKRQVAQLSDRNKQLENENGLLKRQIEKLSLLNEDFKFEIEGQQKELDQRRKAMEDWTADADNTTQSLNRQLQRRDRVIDELLQYTQQKMQAFTENAQTKTTATRNKKVHAFHQNERSQARNVLNEEMQPLDQNDRMDESSDSSYASIVGHGVLKKLRELRSLNDRTEEDLTVRTNTPHRRHHSEDLGVAEDHTVPPRVSHGRHQSEDLGGVQDFIAESQTSQRPYASENLRGVEDQSAQSKVSLSRHNSESLGRVEDQTVPSKSSLRRHNSENLGRAEDQTSQSKASLRRHNSENLGRVQNQNVQSNPPLRRHHSEKVGRAEAHKSQPHASNQGQTSETSVNTRATRRHHNESDDVTSAFIIPDISVDAVTNAFTHPTLSPSARRVLDGLCKHDCKNCTVCTRVASFDAKVSAKHKIHIPKPIPVSERMPKPAPYEDEPTIRPSVDPGLALGMVIKDLTDDVAHLKMEHTRISTAYAKHDTTLGARQRRALKKRLEELQNALERKSDQVYRLYDVLEGQKQSGQQMTEKDLEVTLLSIGIEKSFLDEELDLPWEGIEDTNQS